MVSPKKRMPPSFAPSPPLTATSAASDSELDHPPPQGIAVRPRRSSRRHPSTSPPSSLTLTPDHLHLSRATSHPRPEKASPEPRGPARRGRSARRAQGENALQQALLLVQAACQQQLSSDQYACHVFHLSPVRYQELRRRLAQRSLLDYFDQSIRYEYSPCRATLVLRLMATTVHEYLKEYFVVEVREQLRALAADHTHKAARPCRVPEIVADVKWHGHAHLRLEADLESDADAGVDAKVTDTKSPDSQTWYGAALYPQFVLEIGYTQRKTSLQDLAMEYYTGSHGHIKTVLTLDMEYAPPSQRRRAQSSNRTAALCLYRGPERVHKDMIVRDAQGQPTAHRLQLLLSDFVPEDELEQLDRRTLDCMQACAINITAERLCDLLAEAEAAQARKDANEQQRAQDRKRRRDEEPAPKKRLSVNWAKDVVAASDDDIRSSSPEGDGGSTGPSKRRRTEPDRVYRPRSRSAAAPTDRQTRSASRGR